MTRVVMIFNTQTLFHGFESRQGHKKQRPETAEQSGVSSLGVFRLRLVATGTHAPAGRARRVLARPHYAAFFSGALACMGAMDWLSMSSTRRSPSGMPSSRATTFTSYLALLSLARV